MRWKKILVLLLFVFSWPVGAQATYPFSQDENLSSSHCDHYLLEHFHICHPLERRVSANFDPAIAIFAYQDNRTYVVYTHMGIMTDISLPVGETIEGLFLSDTIRWVHAISQTKQDIFFKPTQDNLFNPITLITNKRRYPVWLVSVSDNHPWYQRVSWVFEQSMSEDWPHEKLLSSVQSIRTPLNIQSTNFGYAVSANFVLVPFYPSAVFDDRVHIWIKMPDHLINWPALFALDEEGHLSVEEYVIQGHYFKTAHLHRCLILKMDARMIKICKKEPFSLKKVIHNLFHPSFLQHHP